MFILDFNQIIISNLMMMLKDSKSSDANDINEDLLRHFVLNSVRKYKTKFSDKYGEMIIACDDQDYWRKDVFPYYKANRKEAQKNSTLNWPLIFKSLNKIRDEIKEFFPYRVIRIDRAEADDIIYTLCNVFGNSSEKILIVSADKDFRQLHRYMNVEQYNPIRDVFITENEPDRFLMEQIIRGDSGDGIPNFLSEDNCLVLKIRQKPISSKKLEVWLDQDVSDFCDKDMMRRYERNKNLIDLRCVPESIQHQAIKEYDNEAGKNRKHLMNYFINNKLTNLMSDLPNF